MLIRIFLSFFLSFFLSYYHQVHGPGPLPCVPRTVGKLAGGALEAKGEAASGRRESCVGQGGRTLSPTYAAGAVELACWYVYSVLESVLESVYRKV
jgi:hypothetical protein